MIEAILQAKLRKIEKIRKRRENKFIRRAHCALSLRLAKDSSKKSDQPICKTYIFSANFKFVLSFKFGKIFALRSAIHPRSCLVLGLVLESSWSLPRKAKWTTNAKNGWHQNPWNCTGGVEVTQSQTAVQSATACCRAKKRKVCKNNKWLFLQFGMPKGIPPTHNINPFQG